MLNNEPPVRTRLDVWLQQKYPDLSRAFLQKLCNSEQILVNGKPEKSGYRLRETDKVKVLYDMDSIDKIEDIDLPIIFENDDVIVINKPAGVISHSRGKYWNEPSVASFVRQITKQSGDRAGIVHRLDRATSGVMVCAKNQTALEFLQKQFSTRKVVKKYQAVIDGHLDPQEAIIDMPIERNPKEPSTFRVGSNGKPSITTYKVLKSSSKHDLVELTPKTGRTHQLRVHMKYLRHPIVGDVLYGGSSYKRLLLHAASIELALPNGEKRTFSVETPKPFLKTLTSDI